MVLVFGDVGWGLEYDVGRGLGTDVRLDPGLGNDVRLGGWRGSGD